MSSIQKITIPISILVLLLYPVFSFIPASTQAVVSIILIVLLGIPHGAIDHILFLEKQKHRHKYFYIMYFGLMSCYLAAWIIWPLPSLLFFILISAFHFGQSQFSDVKLWSKIQSGAFYSTWGISLLSGLLFFNHDELSLLFKSSPDLEGLFVLFDAQILEITLVSTLIIALGFMLRSLYQGRINFKRFILEVASLAILQVCFYFLPLIIGFTLYFTLWHSARVLDEEFTFLKSMRKSFSFQKFLKLIAPFAGMSIVAVFALLISFEFIPWQVSEVLILFIILSILTLPHSLVMDNFYERLYGKMKS